MEGEICTYNKFGFCKFRKECKRIHLTRSAKNWNQNLNVTKTKNVFKL